MVISRVPTGSHSFRAVVIFCPHVAWAGFGARRGKFRILGFGPRLASLRKVLPASFFMAGLVFPRDDTTVHPMKQLSCRFDCFFRRSTNCATSTRSVCAARWFLAELLIFYAVNDGERAVNAAEPEL